MLECEYASLSPLHSLFSWKFGDSAKRRAARSRVGVVSRISTAKSLPDARSYQTRGIRNQRRVRAIVRLRRSEAEEGRKDKCIICDIHLFSSIKSFFFHRGRGLNGDRPQARTTRRGVAKARYERVNESIASRFCSRDVFV